MSSQADTNDTNDQAPEPTGGLAGLSLRVRAWAKANRMKAGLALGTCLVLLSGFAFLWYGISSDRRGPEELVTMEMALASLDKGYYDEARRQAELLREQDNLGPDEFGGPSFVLGAATAYEADATWKKDKQKYYLLAARYLEDGRDRGFPPGRKGEGLYLLGKSLLLSGQIPASRLALGEALTFLPSRRSEIHRMLARAFLEDAVPKPAEARKHNQAYLADTELSSVERHQAILQRARIELLLGKTSECLAALATIPASSKLRAEVMVVRGQVLMHEARALQGEEPDFALAERNREMARRKYEEAIDLFRQAQGRDTLLTQATSKAMYLIGVCQKEAGAYGDAVHQFTRTRKKYANTAEAFASRFQEAELLLQSGQDAKSLAAYREVFEGVSDPANFSNPWLSLEELQNRTMEAYRHYLETQNYEVALQLAQHLSPLFSVARGMELTAETHRAWGHALLEQADSMSLADAEVVRSQGRAQLRRAGSEFSRLAKRQFTATEYTDLLWHSANGYFEGHDYRNATRILDKYLKNESRRRRPRALSLLGQAKLALGRFEEALQDFGECIEFYPKDAASFQARLMAANAYLEVDDAKNAEAMLRENLNSDLTPASKEWRDSLFALGKLLYFAERFDDAMRVLEESVERGAGTTHEIEGNYLIAMTFRRQATTAEERLRKSEMERARMTESRQVRELLSASLEHFQKSRDGLLDRQEGTQSIEMSDPIDLTDAEKAMLRNCHFLIAGTLFDLEQYEAAVKAYSLATNRYRNSPEALEAHVQIANAYRRMRRPLDARGTLEQAKVLLKRMKNDVPFEETTNYTKEEWGERLESLAEM